MSRTQEHCNDTRVSCPGREHLLPGQLAISSAQPNVSMQPPGTPDRSAQKAAALPALQAAADAAAAAAKCDESPRVHRAAPLVAAVTATATSTRTARQSHQPPNANSPSKGRTSHAARSPTTHRHQPPLRYAATSKIPPKVEPTVMRLKGTDRSYLEITLT